MKLPFAQRGPCFKAASYYCFSEIWRLHNVVRVPRVEALAIWVSKPGRASIVDAIRGKITGTFG